MMLVIWVVFFRDFSAVVEALQDCAWGPLGILWLAYAAVTLFFDAGFLWLLLRSTERHAPFVSFLIIRSLTYLLSAPHAALGAGALVVWIQRRFRTKLVVASGLMGIEVVFEIGTLGLLGAIGLLGLPGGLGLPGLLGYSLGSSLGLLGLPGLPITTTTCD